MIKSKKKNGSALVPVFIYCEVVCMDKEKSVIVLGNIKGKNRTSQMPFSSIVSDSFIYQW